MSDKRVRLAVNESISNHEREIGRLMINQSVTCEMMTAPGVTSHALWSLTRTYHDCDIQIGNHRTSIRNLKLQLENM